MWRAASSAGGLGCLFSVKPWVWCALARQEASADWVFLPSADAHVSGLMWDRRPVAPHPADLALRNRTPGQSVGTDTGHGSSRSEISPRGNNRRPWPVATPIDELRMWRFRSSVRPSAGSLRAPGHADRRYTVRDHFMRGTRELMHGAMGARSALGPRPPGPGVPFAVPAVAYRGDLSRHRRLWCPASQVRRREPAGCGMRPSWARAALPGLLDVASTHHSPPTRRLSR
jgi:hypothetical protein